MARHTVDVKNTTPVPTEPHALVARIVRGLVRHRAIGAAYGAAGLGKTYSTEAAVEGLDIAVHWFTPLNRSTMKMVADALLYEITAVEHHGSLSRMTRTLVGVLAERPRLVVVDEAQRLNQECIEYLRHLHDHPDTDFALLLVGGNRCWEVITKHPMVESRIARRIEFKPLTNMQVLRLLPKYHPLYTNVDPELLLLVDDCYAHGNFRSWANFTVSAIDLCREFDIPDLTEDIIGNVFALAGGNANQKVAA
jgi:hypothetical protein